MSRKYKTKVELVAWMSAMPDNVDGYCAYRLEHWLLERCNCPLTNFPDYLFNLETIADLDPGEGVHWFFDFQIPVVQRICKTGARLATMPARLLDEFAAEVFQA